MKTFTTYEEVDGLLPCIKIPTIVYAKQIDEEFRVNSLEGDYAKGKPGDYLMKGIEGELYVCDRDIFQESYSVIVEEGETP